MLLPSLKSLSGKFKQNLRRVRGYFAYGPGQNRMRLKGPLSIQIQTVNKCNASCVMCPYASLQNQGVKHEMDDFLFARILGELKNAGTIQSVNLMLQNEPLLDSRLQNRLNQAKQVLPEIKRFSLSTNGSLLNSECVEQLNKSALTHIGVSIDAFTKETFDKIRRGLNFLKVVKNTENLIERGSHVQVKVRFLKQRANIGEEKAFAEYWRSRGAAISFDTLTNRAGSLNQFELLTGSRHGIARRFLLKALNRFIPACPLPFSSLCTLWDGRVILCCHDWEHRDIIGDLSKQHLGEIWNGDKINHYRKLLWERRAKESLVCHDCSLADGFWH